jgi:hypothetical protein
LDGAALASRPEGSAVWEKSRIPWYLSSFVAAMIAPTRFTIVNGYLGHTIPVRDA